MQWITAEPSWFSSGAYRITQVSRMGHLCTQRFYLSLFSSLKKNFDSFFTQRGAVYSQICTQMNIKELFWVKRIIIIIQFSICTIIATFSWCWFSSRPSSSRACCSWHCVTTNFWHISVSGMQPHSSRSSVGSVSPQPRRVLPALFTLMSDGWVYINTSFWPSALPKTSSASAFAFDYKTTRGPRFFSGPVSRQWQRFSPTRVWAARQSKPPATASLEQR